MDVIVDTHSFLWFVQNDPRLSSRAERLLAQFNTEALLSDASVWEIAIKISIQKLQLPQPLGIFIADQTQRNQFSRLVIGLPHLEKISELPLHHRDPFDRMLVAQAMVEGLPIISADPAFDAYPVERIW